MDAIGVVVTLTGGFLLYAAVKGEHPWTLFTTALGADSTSQATITPTTPVTPTGQADPSPVKDAVGPIPIGLP